MDKPTDSCPDRKELARARRTSIPHLLHQLWLSDDNTSQPPAALRAQAWTWRKRLPSWQCALWAAAPTRTLWAARFPELLSTYDAYTAPVERADASRLLLMHEFGGAYADLDVVPCAGTQQLLERAPALTLVRDPWRGTAARKRAQHVSNFFFVSAPRHPFWAHALRLLPSRQQHRRGTLYRTGPYFVDWAWRQFVRRNGGCPARLLSDGAAVLTHDEWQQRRFGVHHWTSSWHPLGHYHPTRADLQAKLSAVYNESRGIMLNEGLLAWLGVDRWRDCPEGSFPSVFNGTGLQNVSVMEYDGYRDSRGQLFVPHLWGLLLNESAVPALPQHGGGGLAVLAVR